MYARHILTERERNITPSQSTFSQYKKAFNSKVVNRYEIEDLEIGSQIPEIVFENIQNMMLVEKSNGAALVMGKILNLVIFAQEIEPYEVMLFREGQVDLFAGHYYANITNFEYLKDMNGDTRLQERVIPYENGYALSIRFGGGDFFSFNAAITDLPIDNTDILEEMNIFLVSTYTEEIIEKRKIPLPVEFSDIIKKYTRSYMKHLNSNEPTENELAKPEIENHEYNFANKISNNKHSLWRHKRKLDKPDIYNIYFEGISEYIDNDHEIHCLAQEGILSDEDFLNNNYIKCKIFQPREENKDNVSQMLYEYMKDKRPYMEEDKRVPYPRDYWKDHIKGYEDGTI